MMLSVSPTSLAKSSLEEMLESLSRNDECDRPKDLPPALPSRPTSRARLPSARRSLPPNFNVADLNGGADNGIDAPDSSVDSENIEKDETKRKMKDLGVKRKSFGSKKMKTEQITESPYVDGEDGCEMDGLRTSVQVSPVKATGERQIAEADWNDNIRYFIEKRLHVWCRVPNDVWQCGKIQSSSSDEASVKLPNGNVLKVFTEELFPANPEILEGVEDLVQLSYLNEPSVLYNLSNRYSRDLIYSRAGPVLIAINPFKDVQIYGNDFVSAYRQKRGTIPHVYAVVDNAYSKMIREEKNQSIIISGESGAGKTETAKFAMQYLAALSGGSFGVEYEIVETNFILEAFGNAKTSRNDNSSRFGKLTEINFTELGQISGAKIQTFLLEKSRVVQLSSGERSYHIFYQLCAGASPILRERLKLKVASEYYYLNHGDCLKIDGTDDAQKFHKLLEAFDSVQISKEDQECAFAMLAAILWLGNISFQVIDNENHVELLEDEAVMNAAMLMSCSVQDLVVALSIHKLLIGKESIAKRLTLRQAIDTRDALAKFIYASLFDWLVEQINSALEVGTSCSGRSISILDIYGFESFKNNSFEQFCINYANERLQQHFNRHLFKLEQEEYEADGIDWTKVEFEDNQECLDLIEKKPIGLLSLLDEESTFPKATGLTLANKLRQHLKANTCFKGERGRAFRLHHYAGEVMYDTNGFLEKNRDTLHSDLIQLLSSCNSHLACLFSTRMLKQSHRPQMVSDSTSQSVGTKFKGQLFKLMNQLESTTPHFIRCIKPNSKQLPNKYDEDLVLQQLRCCGVLEVVRISRSGYPTRMTHQEFSRRYEFLLSTKACQDPLSISVAILKQFNVPPEMYQIGYTKLYLRSGQIGALEDRKKQVLHSILVVQRWFRCHQACRYFQELRKGAGILQSYIRSVNARRTYAVKEANAASASRALNKEQTAVIYLQSARRNSKMRQQEQLHSNNRRFQMKPCRRASEDKDVPHKEIQVPPMVLAELQKRVTKSEAALAEKEEENSALREKLQEYEMRWVKHEAKLKSMEEMWQKQTASLQVSLAAARKSLAASGIPGQHGRVHTAPPPGFYDSEDGTSTGTAGASTPTAYSNGTHETRMQEMNGSLNAVSILAREFVQRRQTFDEEARSLVEVKTAQPDSGRHPYDELRKLKIRFETWKKDYKTRLREAKARVHRLEADKSRKTWWGKFTTRS